MRIDKGIPLPPVEHRCTYPWHTMEIGDSFLMPAGKTPYSVITNIHKRTNKRFEARRTDQGWRVWRVE